ncbi:MAG TPA: LEPR-XLL domain-containing protein, partial [Verrucomicrobia bacterium]|nr:LEPR-XLL domain-containing protein [Verrucomicrobiota bacterium]
MGVLLSVRRITSQSVYELEALEPRILLSGNGVDPASLSNEGLRSSLAADPTFENIFQENVEFPVAEPLNVELVYDVFEQVEDIFQEVEGEDLTFVDEAGHSVSHPEESEEQSLIHTDGDSIGTTAPSPSFEMDRPSDSISVSGVVPSAEALGAPTVVSQLIETLNISNAPPAWNRLLSDIRNEGDRIGINGLNSSSGFEFESKGGILSPLVSVWIEGSRLRIDGASTEDDDLSISLSPSGTELLIRSSTIEIFAEESGLRVSENRYEVSVSTRSFDFVEVNGLDGNDSLTIDFSTGNPIPSGGLVFNGGIQRTAEGDQLVLQGGTFDTSNYQFENASDGRIFLDDSLIIFTGLEPITDNINSENRVIGMSNNDDIDATLSAGAPGFLTLSGSTFEQVTFSNPTVSLIIDGLDGVDTLTVMSLDSGFNADLAIYSETIIIDSGATIEVAGDLELMATSEDPGLITDTGSLSSRTAQILVEGHLSSTGTITLAAQVVRSIEIISLSTLVLESESVARVDVKSSAQLSAPNLNIFATTRGMVSTENFLGAATNQFTDSAIVSIDESSSIHAGGLEMTAVRSTVYSVKGLDALNLISGNVKATILNSVLEADVAGISLVAQDSVHLTAGSPEQAIDLSALTSPLSLAASSARNHVSGNVQAIINQSILSTAQGGNIQVVADRAIQLASTANTNSLVSSSPVPSSFSLSLSGAYTSNSILGETEASIIDSTITTSTGGGLIVNAQDVSGIDARSNISSTADLEGATLGGIGAVFGASIAFNSIGWDFDSSDLMALDALIGTNFATEKPTDVRGFVLNSELAIEGDLKIGAHSEPHLNATVSNTGESNVSSLSGGSGIAAGGILVSNMVNRSTEAFLEYTTSAKGVARVDGNLEVSALDKTGIYANSKLVSSSTTTNDGGVSVLNDDIGDSFATQFLSGDGTQEIEYGEKVRLADDYAGGGTAGSIYEYMGFRAVEELSGVDYSDLDYWKEITATQIIPEGMNVSDSDSMAIGGLVVRNDVRSRV